jgi:hypothetical protein
LFRVSIKTIKEGFISHVSGDQHTVTHAFGNGIVTITGALHTIAIATIGRARTRYTTIGHELRTPIGVVGLDKRGRHVRRRITITV